jgi:CheY-like chemotaxis protein
MAATILIADDDAVQRRLVENMVQKCGYEPLVVDSGDAAVALLTAPGCAGDRRGRCSTS